jgi:hypothetical protein
MNSAIVEEGSAADGDGHVSYAARRRNLACRPSALGRLTAHTKACRSTAPDQPAILGGPAIHNEQPSSRQTPSTAPGYTIVPDVRLDYQRES